MFELTGNQISLKPTTEADITDVMQMERASDNASFVRQWSRDQHLAVIRDDGMAHLLVWHDSENRAVGFVILLGLLSPDRALEFRRIVITEKARGFGRETVRLIKELAFDKLGMHRLWLDVAEYNQRAYHLYKSEGFVFEGIQRESWKQGDFYTSLRIMSILDREYRDMRKPEMATCDNCPPETA